MLDLVNMFNIKQLVTNRDLYYDLFNMFNIKQLVTNICLSYILFNMFNIKQLVTSRGSSYMNNFLVGLNCPKKPITPPFI